MVPCRRTIERDGRIDPGERDGVGAGGRRQPTLDRPHRGSEPGWPPRQAGPRLDQVTPQELIEVRFQEGRAEGGRLLASDAEIEGQDGGEPIVRLGVAETGEAATTCHRWPAPPDRAIRTVTESWPT